MTSSFLLRFTGDLRVLCGCRINLKKKKLGFLPCNSNSNSMFAAGEAVGRSWRRLRQLHKRAVRLAHTKCMGLDLSAPTLHSWPVIARWRHPRKRPQRGCVSPRSLHRPYKVCRNIQNNLDGRRTFNSAGGKNGKDIGVLSVEKRGLSVLQGDTQGSIMDTLEQMLCVCQNGKTLIHPGVFSFLHTEPSEPAAPANSTLSGSRSK